MREPAGAQREAESLREEVKKIDQGVKQALVVEVVPDPLASYS